MWCYIIIELIGSLDQQNDATQAKIKKYLQSSKKNWDPVQKENENRIIQNKKIYKKIICIK